MGRRFETLSEQHMRFIAAQKIFFVATATAGSRVNLSPKGMDALRVVDWAVKKGDAGVRDYWAEKNQLSLDGIPTRIVEKNR